MTSIFEHALGADFRRLHPRLRERFGFASADGIACVGIGIMDTVWHGRGFTRPFLAMGARRNVLVRQAGQAIPFTIANYAYADSFGRETMTFSRTFHFGTPQHWDATMIHSAERGTIVDYLGTHQHIAVDLHPTVDENGSLLISSGEQRLHEGPLALRIPGLVTGQARLRESYDERIGKFRIEVAVTNRWFGPLFGYRGTFDVDYPACDMVPVAVQPVREQLRT